MAGLEGGAVGRRGGGVPGERGEGQPQADRRVAGEQDELAAPQVPGGRHPPRRLVVPAPPVRVGGEGQHPADGIDAVEGGDEAGPGGRVGEAGIGRVEVDLRGRPGGEGGLGGQGEERVLVGGQHRLGAHAQPLGDAVGHGLDVGLVGGRRGLRVGVGQEGAVPPQRLAVGAPGQPDVPAGEGLARVPLALAVLDDAAGRPPLPQPPGEVGGQAALVGPVGGDGPLRRLHVVDRHERRLAAHRQPHVPGDQPLVDGPAEGLDGLPLRFPVRLGDPWVLVHPGDPVAEPHLDLDHLGGAGDGGGRGRLGGAGQRDVALAGEQPGGRVEADPAGAGQEHLGPGVEVGEVLGRPAGTVEGGQVGDQLDQVAGHEAGGQAEVAQHLDEQPGRVPARADAPLQGVLGLLDAGLHADRVGDLGLDAPVDVGHEVRGAGPVVAPLAQVLHHGVEPRPTGIGDQVRHQVPGQHRLVGEGDVLGLVVEEEVEGVDHRHVGDQVDDHGQLVGPLGEDQPGQVVAERVLLPAHEVVGRGDRERVGQDRRPGVGRGAEPHHVGREGDRPGEPVGGAVLEGDVGADPSSLPPSPHTAVSPMLRVDERRPPGGRRLR